MSKNTESSSVDSLSPEAADALAEEFRPSWASPAQAFPSVDEDVGPTPDESVAEPLVAEPVVAEPPASGAAESHQVNPAEDNDVLSADLDLQLEPTDWTPESPEAAHAVAAPIDEEGHTLSAPRPSEWGRSTYQIPGRRPKNRRFALAAGVSMSAVALALLAGLLLVVTGNRGALPLAGERLTSVEETGSTRLDTAPSQQTPPSLEESRQEESSSAIAPTQLAESGSPENGSVLPTESSEPASIADSEVEFTVQVAPRDAVLVLDNRPIKAGTQRLLRSNRTRHLVASRPGYEPLHVELIPDRDRSLSLELHRVERPATLNARAEVPNATRREHRHAREGNRISRRRTPRRAGFVTDNPY